jgi:Putative glycosyl hydrolase of unknown function (DUF1680)
VGRRCEADCYRSSETVKEESVFFVPPCSWLVRESNFEGKWRTGARNLESEYIRRGKPHLEERGLCGMGDGYACKIAGSKSVGRRNP